MQDKNSPFFVVSFKVGQNNTSLQEVLDHFRCAISFVEAFIAIKHYFCWSIFIFQVRWIPLRYLLIGLLHRHWRMLSLIFLLPLFLSMEHSSPLQQSLSPIHVCLLNARDELLSNNDRGWEHNSNLKYSASSFWDLLATVVSLWKSSAGSTIVYLSSLTDGQFDVIGMHWLAFREMYSATVFLAMADTILSPTRLAWWTLSLSLADTPVAMLRKI